MKHEHHPLNPSNILLPSASIPNQQLGLFIIPTSPGKTRTELTKVNKVYCNEMIISYLPEQVIACRLRHFAHIRYSQLTTERSELNETNEKDMNYRVNINVNTTCYDFNLSTRYPFKPLTLSCSLIKTNIKQCH